MGKIIYTLEEGPVKVLSNRGKGINKTYDIWYGMTCTEFFPADTDTAYYVVKISKSVSSSSEHAPANKQLLDLIETFQDVWILANGIRLLDQRFERRIEIPFSNNAEKVRQSLLKKEGVTEDIRRMANIVQLCTTYVRFPLKHAIELARLTASYPELNELFKHFHVGMANNPLWFSELYKLKDDMKRLLNTDRPFKELSLDGDGRFERILSKDRHSPQKGKESNLIISSQEKEEVRKIGRELVEAYIRHIGHGDLLITPPAG